MAAKYFYALFVFIYIQFKAFSQDESFETTVPSYWATTNGTLSTSTDHYKDGNQSLKWDWSANAVMTVSNLQSHGLSVSEVLGYYQHFFRMWVYNTSSIPAGELQIEFYDNTGTKQFYYSFRLNFTGWRAATADYLNEMSGNKTSSNITTMKIKAPASGNGTVYFDYIDFTMPRITERAKDYQLPFIPNIGGDLHWIEMMYYQFLPKTFAATTPSGQELADLAVVKQLYNTMIKGSAPNSTALNNAILQYNAANISYSNGIVKGNPLYGKDNPDTENIQVVENFLLTFARDYKFNSTTSSKDYFLNSVRYLLDQGYAEGSLVETVHHIGYSFRNIPSAVHLMQSELTAAGLWDQAQKMVEWYSAVDGIWSPDASSSNMDDGNTRTIPRLGACLYKSIDAEKVQYLKGFKQYLETFLTLYSKEEGGMKIDFTGFHHNAFYPGYSFPSNNILAQAIGYISQGAYAVNANAHSILKKSLLLSRVVSEGGHIPNSLSGRNPFVTPSFKNGLKNLGLANPVDAVLLKAHNYTYGSDSQTSAYGTETPPTGFWQINFANLGAYRQSTWVADIKGFNKYFWGTEIYSSENRYGRYQSYGAIEILYPGGYPNSLLNINGWDWNKTPGATTKHLTNNNLVAATVRQDEKTDSNFAASLRLGSKSTYYIDQKMEGNYGMFGMDFTQKALSPTHDTSFKFKKSVFCFDGKIICLGSNINSADGLIATNLFQNNLNSTSTSINVDNTAVATFPYTTTLSSTSSHWILDAAGTGYFIKSGNSIVIDRKNQSSPKETGDGTFTTGNFASAYISHGTAPTNTGYEYVIIPQTTGADMVTFSNNMTVAGTAFYQVIQKNQTAHIVKYNTMYGYSLFGTGNYGTSTPIQGNNAPCLVMTNQTGNNLALSFVNPDLNFAANNGASQASPIVITVYGEWSMDTFSGGTVNATVGAGITTLTIQAKDGLPVDISLSPITTTWNGSSWSNGAPTSAIDAFIVGNYSELSDITAKTLTVNNDAIVSIPSNYNVTLSEALTVNSGSFTLNNNANLIQSTTIANSGNIIIKRNSNPLSHLDYTIWSSPITNASQYLLGFSPSTLTNRFYNYNTTTNLYNAVANPSTTPFAKGAGYLIRMPDTAVPFPSTEIFTGIFTGVPNNGDVQVSLNYVDATHGYNMVGNPYPSTINAETFLTANAANIESTLYFWRKTNGASGSAYATYTLGGATTSTPTSAAPNGTIQIGQGFFVKAKRAVTVPSFFTNAMRVANNTNQFFKTKAIENNRVWLNLTNTSGVFSQMLVGYRTNASTGVDYGMDGKYINDSPIALTSNINNEEYTIQFRSLPFDSNDVVPLNFKTNLDGEYSIGIDHVDGIFSGNQEIILVDNATKIQTDLKTNSYTFTAKAGIDNTRFTLKYQKTLQVETREFNDNSVTVYKNKGMLFINSASIAIDNIKVYNMQGRLITEQKNVNANTSVIKDLKAAHQVLIVKIVSENKKSVTKKVMY
jgi:hypothetical protein